MKTICISDRQQSGSLATPLLATSAESPQTHPAARRQPQAVDGSASPVQVSKLSRVPATPQGALLTVPGSAAPVLTKSFLAAWAKAGSSKEENRQRRAIAKEILPNALSAIFRPPVITIKNHDLITELPQGLDCGKDNLELKNLASLRDLGRYTRAGYIYIDSCPQLKEVNLPASRYIDVKNCHEVKRITSHRGTLIISNCRTLHQISCDPATKVLRLDRLPELEQLPERLALNSLWLSKLPKLHQLPADLEVRELFVDAGMAKKLDLSRFAKVTLLDSLGVPSQNLSRDGATTSSISGASEYAHTYTFVTSS